MPDASVDTSTFAPDFRLLIDGSPIPAVLRASISSVKCETGFEGVDQLEVSLVNDQLRWLDQPAFKLDTGLTLQIGYAPQPLTQVFDGEIVARAAEFPSGGAPSLTITAQDRRHKMQEGKKVRWFAIPIPCVGNLPLPDIATAPLVALENLLIPLVDPVGAALSVILGGVDMAVAITDPGSAQKVIRKQANESDYDFLARIAAENGWDMMVEHDGPLGGHMLHFTSPLDHLSADVTLGWGRSLIEFTPRISKVGQIVSVGGFVWVPAIKMVFNVTVGFDWDRMSLTLSIVPGVVPFGQNPTDYLIDEPLTPTSIPRKLIGELLPKLNNRLTASGSTVGDPRIRAGTVVRIEGVGEEFGGLYRVTSATHTLDAGGYRTSFEARKEIWFGSIPLGDQGAIPVRVSF
jgi:phage protein D